MDATLAEMSSTAKALIGFAAWQLVLTFALAIYRTTLVQTGRKAANDFSPDGSDVSEFGQRLTRARDNCYENLPVFAALVAGATLAGKTAILDPLAMTVLYARVGQSLTHVASTSVPAIFVRFGFYLVQVGIMLWWVRLLLGS
jgi:uncharacterized MAPEG superfamily protein